MGVKLRLKDASPPPPPLRHGILFIGKRRAAMYTLERGVYIQLHVTVAYTYTHIHMYTCTHVHMYICTHVHMYTCTHVHMYTCTHVHMYTCTYIHMYTCTHVHMYSTHYSHCTYVVHSTLRTHQSLIYNRCTATVRLQDFVKCDIRTRRCGAYTHRV